MLNTKPFNTRSNPRIPSGSSEGQPGRCLELFFETSIDDAGLLLLSKKLLPLNQGDLGKGIYFALNSQQMKQYSDRNRVIFKANVKVGRALIIRNSKQLRNYTHAELQDNGYGSILITCLQGGHQYVIFDSKQVLDIQKISGPTTENHRNIRQPRKDIKQANHRSYSEVRPDSTPCPYGNRCYRQNPDHIRECHPVGYKPALLPIGGRMTTPKESKCVYGDKCYRQNPDHIRNCHSIRFKPAQKRINGSLY